MRNQPMQLEGAPRCGAKTRKGTPCAAPAVHGKRRCRMHGGAKGSGAQPGNTNAWKHGWYSAQNRTQARQARSVARLLRQLAIADGFEEGNN